MNGKEFIINVDPVILQEAGVLTLYTKDAITFAGDFTYSGKDQPEAKATLNYNDNEKSAMMIGEWSEDDQIYTCIISLQKVDQFQLSEKNTLRFV